LSKAPSHTGVPGFLRARLAADHYLGLPLTAGLLAVLSCAALFALIAVHALSPGALPNFDQHLADWLHVRNTPFLSMLLLGMTHLHGTIGILLMSALLALVLLRRQAWAWLLTLGLTVPAGMLFNYALKHVFVRQRPQFEQPLLVLHSYSFPSGHTIGATLFYCVLAGWLISLPANQERRAVIIAISTTMVLLTGFSRLYLGAHFFSDVLAAMLEGIAWFSCWATIIFTIQRHQGDIRAELIGR
jgi:membrane-associated phospholipid phosphatase